MDTEGNYMICIGLGFMQHRFRQIVLRQAVEQNKQEIGRLHKMGVQHLVNQLSCIEIGEERRRQPGGNDAAAENCQQSLAQGTDHLSPAAMT